MSGVEAHSKIIRDLLHHPVYRQFYFTRTESGTSTV